MSISLGAAAPYAIIAATTITNTGSSVVTGGLALYPGTSVTGFPPGTYSGAYDIGGGAGGSASIIKQAAQDAYTACVNATTTNTLSASTYITTDNQSLSAGVYAVGTSLQINGNLILTGNSSSVFIFKIGSTLTTASSATITLSGGVDPCKVFWQVGSSATIGTSTAFNGIILAQASITCTTSAIATGAFYALTGAVTLDTNRISDPCVCYMKGTNILTANGYKKIEEIAIGDEIAVTGTIRNHLVTPCQSTKKVIFTGSFTRTRMDADSKPIVFTAGSLGENTPSENVMVSPGHGVIMLNKMVVAKSLVNGDTIYQSDSYESVTYYHIELEDHSVINASGLLGEWLLGCHDKFE